MKPSEQFITSSLGEGLIVARHDGHRLFVMNESARFIWERRVGGAADADIPELMASHYGIAAEQAELDFRRILRRWQVEGLATSPGPCHHYRIGEADFSVKYSDRTVYEAMVPVLGHLESRQQPNGDGRSRTFALDADSDRFVLRADGVELLGSGELDETIAKLAHEAVMCAYGHSGWLISMHAAAVSRGRGCVLLPGASGSGKSTLTAALLARPHIRYLTDDLALLDRANLRVIPVAGALALKRGSWEALHPLLPTLSSQTAYRRGEQDVRYMAPSPDQIASAPAPVEAVVFPRFEHGASDSLVPISALEGLHHVIAAPCTISPPITAETVERVAAWAREIPFYTLIYGSVARAAVLIDGLLAP
jgi:hypothetical protein